MKQKGKIPVSHQAFFYLAILFAVCVAIQVFFAGMATFTDPSKWQLHTNFVKIIEYIPIIMLILAFAGKLPKLLRWQSVGLFFLIFLMYATANMPVAGALHPVIALVMFWFAIFVSQKAWNTIYKMEGRKKQVT